MIGGFGEYRAMVILLSVRPVRTARRTNQEGRPELIRPRRMNSFETLNPLLPLLQD